MTAVVCVVTLNAVASGALVLGAVAAENIAANTSVAGATLVVMQMLHVLLTCAIGAGTVYASVAEPEPDFLAGA